MEVSEFLPDTYRNVLEVGCSAGGFFVNLNKAENIWGIEPDAGMAESIPAEKYHARILVGRYEDVETELPDNYFDLIVCNDVIEHMLDPGRFLESVKAKMTSDGSLVGSIPNVRYYRNLYNLLFKKDWKYEEKGILDRTHLRFFTEKSVKRLLWEHRYEIDLFRGINRSRITSIRKRSILQLIGLLTRSSYKDIHFQQFGFRCRLQ